jgi:hypothetical protein
LRACSALSCAAVLLLFVHTVTAADYVSNHVDLYNSATGVWSTAQLSTAAYHLAATSVGNMALFASGVVDVYNSATGTWSTAQLSVARSRLAATSVGNMAMFAGGEIVWRGTLICFNVLLTLWFHCHASVCPQVLFQIAWTSTTVQPVYGRQLSSASRVLS